VGRRERFLPPEMLIFLIRPFGRRGPPKLQLKAL
jgi:hypothetical protein